MNEVEILSGYYNAELVDDEPDRTYEASDLNEYFKGLVSDSGIYATISGACRVAATSSGMSVIVKSGRGKVNNHWFHNIADTELEIESADVVLTRKDRIVARWINSERAIKLKVLTGTATSTPEAPAIERNDNYYDISLAIITVEPNAKSIGEAKIHDTRPDSSVCGWIACLIDHFDTTELYNEYQASFSDWFNGIKEQVKATSLVRVYKDIYRTISENEQTITIPSSINYLNNGLDILEVAVNGRELVEDVDYAINSGGSTITLTQALEKIGTKVIFKNTKSIDGLAAESVVVQVETLQEKVDGLQLNNNYTYVANGINDNVTLSNIVKDFLNAVGDYSKVKENASLLINVNGELAVSELIEGQMVFDFHNSIESNRRVIVDFGNATIQHAQEQQINLLALFGCNDNVTIRNANILIEEGKAITIYGFHGGVIQNCWINISSSFATTIYGVYVGDVSNSKINVNKGYAVYGSKRCQFNDITGAVKMSEGIAIGNRITGTVELGTSVQNIGNIEE